jgi:two-component system chemotaxis sensor kinase CheA
MTVDQILHYGTVVIKPLPPLLKDFNALQGIVFDENYRIIPVLNIPDILRRFKVVNIYDVKNLEVHKMHKIHSILVVDDSHTTRHIEKIILEAENYNVTTAVDGIDALEKMKQHEFDLVVTDVKMPRMDGFVLIHNMRHMEELKHIPVIVISSVFESDTEEKNQEARRAGLHRKVRL